MRLSIHLALFWQGTASFETKPHALAVCLHISRVMVSAYSRAASVSPLFVKSIFSTMVDTSGMGVVAFATEDCRKGSRTFQEEQPGCLARCLEPVASIASKAHL